VPLARPLILLDVEVAPVKAGTTSFRCAAVRFEAETTSPDARRIVADCAGRLARATFALDSHMQNVDIICVARDGGRNLDGSLMVFPGDEVPIFTASVQRKNVVLASPAWLNAPTLDGGMWLRARSRLYINDRALPARPEPVAITSPNSPLTLPAKKNPVRRAPVGRASRNPLSRTSPHATDAPEVLRPYFRPSQPAPSPRSLLRPSRFRPRVNAQIKRNSSRRAPFSARSHRLGERVSP